MGVGEDIETLKQEIANLKMTINVMIATVSAVNKRLERDEDWLSAVSTMARIALDRPASPAVEPPPPPEVKRSGQQHNIEVA